MAILETIAQDHPFLRSALIVVPLFLVLWRLWRFTLLPILRPNDPEELPYWIPVLGHGIAFFHNSAALLTTASQYFGPSAKEPFALTAFGITFYVVAEPKQTSEVYKNTQSFSFEVFVQDVMKCNGLSPAGIKAAFSPLARDKPGFPNPHGEPLMALVRRMHQHQLYPGDNLKDIEARFLAWFDRNLQLPVLQRDCVDYAVLKNSASVNVPLLPWCSEFFTRAGEVAYFGDTMGQIDPKLAETFLEFDELSWQILYQYPAVLTRTLNKNRHRLLSAFKKYIQIPKSQRGSQAWFMAAFEDELRSLDVNDADIATMLLTKYWVVSTNTRKALFWLLTYLLYNPQHIDAIRAETSSAFQGDTLVDPRYLQEQCPHLDAVWYETLRMASNSASVRPVQKDTVIGGKTLRKGSRILVPYRLLHFDERVFGAEIDAFKPERFLGKAKALTQCSSWRPFGGGKTMCTGRYVAKNTVTAFVSILVRRFNISLVGNPSIPEADLGRPVLGIMAPKDAQHLVVTIAPRSLKV